MSDNTDKGSEQQRSLPKLQPLKSYRDEKINLSVSPYLPIRMNHCYVITL